MSPPLTYGAQREVEERMGETYPPSMASNPLLPVLSRNTHRLVSLSSCAVMNPPEAPPGWHLATASLTLSTLSSLKPLISRRRRRGHMATSFFIRVVSLRGTGSWEREGAHADGVQLGGFELLDVRGTDA